MDRYCIDGYQVHGWGQGVIDGPLVDGYQDHGNIKNHGGVHDNSVVVKLKYFNLGSYSSSDDASFTHTTSVIGAVHSTLMPLLYAIQTSTISNVDT